MRKTYDFIGLSRRGLAVSAVLVLLALGGLLGRGLELSIDFVGGTSFLVEDVGNGDVTGEQLDDAATGAGALDVTAQLTTDDGEVTGAIVRTAAIEPGSDREAAVVAALQEAAGATTIDTTFVGPSWGERVSGQALRALVVFLVVVVIYISTRLEPKMAGAAIVALVHDVVITIGLYALFGFTLSPATVIALLTILGYSLYDSVVVFDRVEENVPLLDQPGAGQTPGRRTYGEIVNTSLNEVLWRSINTSITSLLPVGALLFVGAQLLGAETLSDLALALFLGMFLGAYSSIFVAGPFLAWWKEQEPEYARLRNRLADRTESGEAADDDEPEAEVPAAGGQAAPITTEYVRGRGRKNKRRR